MVLFLLLLYHTFLHLLCSNGFAAGHHHDSLTLCDCSAIITDGLTFTAGVLASRFKLFFHLMWTKPIVIFWISRWFFCDVVLPHRILPCREHSYRGRSRMNIWYKVDALCKQRRIPVTFGAFLSFTRFLFGCKFLSYRTRLFSASEQRSGFNNSGTTSNERSSDALRRQRRTEPRSRSNLCWTTNCAMDRRMTSTGLWNLYHCML